MDRDPRAEASAIRRSRAGVLSFIALMGVLACALILSLDQAEMHQPLQWLLRDARN
jgi:hypothetical protein